MKLQAHPDKYNSATECFKQSLKQEGIRGLYKGCLPPILTQGMINSLLFFGESSTMHLLQPDLKPGEMGTSRNTILAGCAGGILQCVLLVPSDVVKCVMQAEEVSTTAVTSTNIRPTGSAGAAATTAAIKEVEKNAFVRTYECIQKIYRAEGLRGFYKGLGMTVMREAPSIGFYFFVYRSTKEIFTEMEGRPKANPSTAAILASGGIAGAASWSVVYPFDVIKTNMQIAPLEANGKVIGAWDMTKRLYKNYGSKVFFRGLGTTVFRAFPVNASTFFVYEKLKEIYHFD